MPIVTVGTAATLLSEASNPPTDMRGGPQTVAVQNDSAVNVYLGLSSSVTTTDYDYRLAAGGEIAIGLDQNVHLWAVVASGSEDVAVMRA
jgi:hypothetical protein